MFVLSRNIKKTYRQTSSGVPWYSGKSTSLATTLCGKLFPRIATNSSSFLAFPVTKVIVLDILNFVFTFRVGVDVKSEIHSMAYFNNHLTLVQMSPCINASHQQGGSPSLFSRRHMFVGPAQPHNFFKLRFIFFVYIIGVSLFLSLRHATTWLLLGYSVADP